MATRMKLEDEGIRSPGYVQNQRARTTQAFKGSGTNSLPIYTRPTGTFQRSAQEIAAQQAAAAAAAAQARLAAEAAAARERANAAARAASQKQNENTRALADAQYKLLGSFASQRDTKLSNIATAQRDADSRLLKSYLEQVGGLLGVLTDNEKTEADATFSNIANAMRERADILNEVAALGAGETDQIKAQMQVLRNASANQQELNRAFYDTQRSGNRAVTGLNVDTATGRANLFNQAEADREAAWANYYNQIADTWTQIQNIENANTNVDSDTSVAYKKAYTQAASEAAKAAASSYKRQSATGLDEWEGKQGTRDTRLTNTQAAVVNLGEQKRAEGATLRKW